jgi:membrane associated rhomboid family serine protease
MDQEEKQRFYKSMLIPGFLVILLWVIKIVEASFQFSLAGYGLLPHTLSGLRGILFSPLLHADWKHLSANSAPLFLLASGLFYYYGKKAMTILFLCWFVTGLWVWIFALDSGIHIGASGVVYALATFHFTGGVLRREPRMMAFSLLVVFLYGSMVWGVIPDFFPEKNISWESHLLGGLAGILIAFAYRGEGPQRKIYHWDEEDENAEYIEEETEPTVTNSATNGYSNGEKEPQGK